MDRLRPSQPLDHTAPTRTTLASRMPARLALAIVAATLSGCADRSTLVGGSSASQMKTSLSHLQFENEQLKTEVAKLKEENRSMEDRLVQEQIHTGDLAARLDNARNLLRDRGLDSDTRIGSRSGAADPDADLSRPRTLPAGRSSRKPRKPPAAAIPGELDAQLPSARDDDDGGTISFRSPGSARPRPKVSDETATAARDDDGFVWQPVAQGSDPPASSRR